jgi:Icc-related predicted phosphoesterase
MSNKALSELLSERKGLSSSPWDVFKDHHQNMEPPSKPRVVRLPGQRCRNIATALLNFHPLHAPSSYSALLAALPVFNPPIRVICISDTHDQQLPLPSGDVLIHAGDLTENGSLDEIQSQLTWLSSQPHRHKILVAGNHDVLLDETFLNKYPERRYGQQKTMQDLDFGSVQYLCDSSITLDLESPNESVHWSLADSVSDARDQRRTLTVYGSPRTPQYGVSAFQYPPNHDVWAGKIPRHTDVVVIHGPPRFHLDARDFHRVGCPYLGREIARVRPRLMVFGHIHASYGREDVVLDAVRRDYEDIMGNWASWGALCRMAVAVLWARLIAALLGKQWMMSNKWTRVTTFVNAAVVGGSKNELQHEPIEIQL